jgi:hypothetical protein
VPDVNAAPKRLHLHWLYLLCMEAIERMLIRWSTRFALTDPNSSPPTGYAANERGAVP